MLRIHRRGEPGYGRALDALARRGDADLERVEPEVRAILSRVRDGGDAAVQELTERFEGRRNGGVMLDEGTWRGMASEAPRDVREALQAAAERIRAYHERQVERGFRFREDGLELGMRVRPIGAVGVYAPGGKARYPSTVLMTAVPAQVAGVERIVLATPRPTAEVMAAAEVAGVTEVLDMGGAQAVAALAYGTETVRPVDKIVGPGNIYVACAKRLVFGTVDIDSIAGPSEILVVADDRAEPRFVAADLLSQAEHDEDAYPLLVATTAEVAEHVSREIRAQLSSLPRRSIAEASLDAHGHAFVSGDLDEAARIADRLAPEHLSLAVRDPEGLFARIGAAGAVFLGDHTPETAGDYAAGPSHVLPTGGSARFASPLGVYDFVARTSIIQYEPRALARHARLLEGLARLEGLEGHARAVAIRRRG